MTAPSEPTAARQGTFLQTMRAVAWSFFGVRKSAAHERDVRELNPVHVIAAGLIAAIIFIVALVMLVHWVIASGVAAGNA